MFNVLYESGNKETIKICTYESGYMHLDGLAENLQCKISASLEACLRAHERKDTYLESLRVIS